MDLIHIDQAIETLKGVKAKQEELKKRERELLQREKRMEKRVLQREKELEERITQHQNKIEQDNLNYLNREKRFQEEWEWITKVLIYLFHYVDIQLERSKNFLDTNVLFFVDQWNNGKG